jgi:pimeloyl-ACP methyl ester carboxylesterase
MHVVSRLSPSSRWLLSALLAAACALFAIASASSQAVKKDDAKKDEAKKDEAKKDEPKKDDPGDDKKSRLDTTTDDGVRIIGDFYRSPRGRNAPVVLLLHPIGPGKQTASRKDWDKFPEQLQGKGFNVVTFDFRGHGDSKDIKEPRKYWQVPAAGLLGPHQPKRNFPPAKPPTTIDMRDYGTALELAQMGNDLIAVKKWLHLKNNAQELNSSNLCVVAAEQAATLAVMWIYNECAQQSRARGLGKYEGDDISCVVWLSMPPVLANSRVEVTMEECLKSMKEKFPTLAIYGEQDNRVKQFWSKALSWIKPKDDKTERFKGTGIIPIKGTSLVGTKLLGNETFGTEDEIIKYISKYEKLKPDNIWREQKLNELPTLFVVSNLGLPGPK